MQELRKTKSLWNPQVPPHIAATVLPIAVVTIVIFWVALNRHAGSGGAQGIVAVFGAEDGIKAQDVASQIFSSGSRGDLLRFLTDPKLQVLVSTNPALRTLLEIASTQPIDTGATFQIDLPQDVLNSLVSTNRRCERSFARMIDDFRLGEMRVVGAPLYLWQTFEFPYRALSCSDLRATADDRPMLEERRHPETVSLAHADSDDIPRPLSSVGIAISVYAREGCPIVTWMEMTHDEKGEGQELFFVKQRGGDQLKKPISREQYFDLQRDYFSYDDRGFYGLYIPFEYHFARVTHFARTALSVSEVCSIAATGAVSRIEYVTSYSRDCGRYTVCFDENGKRQVLGYSTLPYGRLEYRLSGLQWEEIRRAAEFTELRFFFKPGILSTNCSAVAIRCDIDWANEDYISSHLTDKFPLP